jgi:hypothetical protein
MIVYALQELGADRSEKGTLGAEFMAGLLRASCYCPSVWLFCCRELFPHNFVLIAMRPAVVSARYLRRAPLSRKLYPQVDGRRLF